jgi:hypothetical protein
MHIINKKSLLDEVRDGVQFCLDLADIKSIAKSGGVVREKASYYFRNALKRNRAQNPISPNQADIVQWVLYDRFIFAAGTTVPNQFQFFSVPSGSGGKTNVDTNVGQVKRLEDPQWMNTFGVGFYFNPNVLFADLNSFENTEYMEFWIGQKAYLQGPIQCFPGAAGLTGGQTSTPYFVNGTPRPSDIFDVRLPAGLQLGSLGVTDGLMGLTILQGQSFYTNCYAPSGGASLTVSGSGGTGLTIMNYLYGILSRAVQ